MVFSCSLREPLNLPPSHPDTPGTKLVAKAEICWSREIKGRPTPEVKEDFPFCTFTGRLLEVKKGGGPHPIISLDMHPPGSRVGSILEKSCTCILGRILGPVRCGERKKLIGHM